MKMQWYIVYTKPRAEKRVSEVLTRKKIENYLAFNRLVRNQSIGDKITNEALFKGYIFVYVTEKQLHHLKKLSGILNLVYWLGKPVVVNDNEIDALKRFLADHINVTAEKFTLGEAKIKKAEISSAEEGPLRSVSHKKVKIVLPSLGYAITAETETSKLRIIPANNYIHQIKSGPAKLLNPVSTFYNFLKN